jgi:hypothetical protein
MEPMSMLWAWERMLQDPARVEAQTRELEAARAPTEEDDAAPPTLRCKACGYEGPERYCPHCLADTMIAVRKLPVPR